MRTGTDFHGLELLTFCGSGALGEVYRCRDLSGKILAVKIIPKQKLGGEWRRELKGVTYYRSLTENSPELLQIHHIGEDEENFFYTMDAADNAVLDGDSYVPDTLAYRLRSGRIPPLALIRIARDILEGLSVIHTAGLFHRDIKPENILFVNGKARIGDMGLMASEQTMLTHMAGTLAFLPPEMRSDNFTAEAPVVSRGDFYALGKVIYCAFTGKSPEEFPLASREHHDGQRLEAARSSLSRAVRNRSGRALLFPERDPSAARPRRTDHPAWRNAQGTFPQYDASCRRRHVPRLAPAVETVTA